MTALTDISLLSFDEPFISKRGSKSCKLKYDTGDLTHTPNSFLRVPFVPSTFDKDPLATRLSLVIECDEEMHKYALALDEWAISYLATHSERIFKKSMTVEQVRVNYNSLLKQQAGYAPTLKCKIDTEGRRGVCCWNESGEQLPHPEHWRQFAVKPKLHFSHLWIMGAQYGIVVQMTDALLTPSESAPAVRENTFI